MIVAAIRKQGENIRTVFGFFAAISVAAIKQQGESIRNNRSVFVVLGMVAISIIIASVRLKIGLTHTLGYLFTMWLCALVVDMYAIWKPAKHDDIVMREPKKELRYVLVFISLAFVVSILRFGVLSDWNAVKGITRMGVFVGALLFVYPIALAIVMLVRKYKPVQLGMRPRALAVALPVIAIIGATAYLVAPQNLMWQQAMKEMGIVDLLVTGFITAALSEEFWRVIAQTRMGAVLRSSAWGWLIATAIWAFLHAPRVYAENHSLSIAIMGAVNIIPLGLLWGYMTHRLKSILPAVLVHGTNLWGLQNM